jgi:hypothetical protein
VTAFAIFALTTGGPVQIQRISRERAPLSMMVLGRGSARLPVSDRYDDFVYPGGGPVEKFFGPFPEGGFRLEVSAAIDSGDSWQLAAFMAHAVVAAGGHNLCRDGAEAETILCLTGTVDFDGLIGGVGHIPEKLRAAREDLTEWRAGPAALIMIAPSGDDHDRLLADQLASGLTILGAKNVGELCAELDIPLVGAAPVAADIHDEQPEAPKRGRAFEWSLLALVLLAGAFVFFTRRDVSPPAKPPTVTLDLKPAPAPPAKPAATPSVAKPSPTVLPDTKPAPEPAPESALSEARLPRLSVWERHAPVGHACTEVYFDKIEAELRPVPLVAGNRFKTSQGSALCGILLRMELGPNEIYAAAGLELLSGRFVGALRPPPDLSGRRSVKGRHEWPLDLPHRVAGPVRYRLSLTTSSTAIRAQNQPGAGKTITLEHEVLQ